MAPFLLISKPQMHEKVAYIFELDISNACAAYNALLNILVLAHPTGLKEPTVGLAIASIIYWAVALPSFSSVVVHFLHIPERITHKEHNPKPLVWPIPADCH